MKSTPEAFQKIISGDFGGYVKIWEMADILKQVNSHMIKALEKGSYAPLEYLEYLSQYPHPSFRTQSDPHPTHSHVTCVECDQTKIVSGSRDKSVVINDYLYSYRKEQAAEAAVRRKLKNHPRPYAISYDQI